MVAPGEGAIGFFWLAMPWEATDSFTTAAIGFGDGFGDGEVLEGSNVAGLNRVVAFSEIWFDATLAPVAPVCGVSGTPACPSKRSRAWLARPVVPGAAGFGGLAQTGGLIALYND